MNNDDDISGSVYSEREDDPRDIIFQDALPEGGPLIPGQDKILIWNGDQRGSDNSKYRLFINPETGVSTSSLSVPGKNRHMAQKRKALGILQRFGIGRFLQIVNRRR